VPDLYVAKQKLSPKPSAQTTLPKTLLAQPVNIRFATQKNDEIIYFVLRKHWITNLGWIISGILLFFIPLFFIYFPVIAILPNRYKIIVFIGWYLLLIAFIFEKFLSWFFNVGIVTNQRVVDIDFYGLLYKEITDAELDKIEDVTDTQIGAIRTIFDFGNITVQTAGKKEMIEFIDIPNPRKVAKLLQELR